MSKYCVVITTAGNGAFVKVDGRECLLRAVDLFMNREAIGQLIVVFDAAAMEESRKKFGPHLVFSGVKLAAGGATLQSQLAAAVPLIAGGITHVLLHDAARPAVAFSDIEAILEAGEKHSAVGLVAPLRGELLQLDEADAPVGFADNRQYVQLLTPQSFDRARFVAMAENQRALHGSEFFLLQGSSLNIRVQSAADAALAKAMIHLLPKPKLRPLDNPFQEAQW